MSSDSLFSRDEVLGGLPARRATALLFLIESRTAHLVERARHAMAPFRTEDAELERDLAFVEAFALGREPPLRPSIQHLERHAPEWADLVPENPRIRAVVAHLLGQKHQFTASDVPQLRTVLGLDTPDVQAAHRQLYRESLDTIYADRVSVVSRLRWFRASLSRRLESLPPFWTAFTLTLSETIGSGILALPIAMAGVGPIPAIMLLIVVGLVNVVTLAWMAEATSRTASIRYSGAYFGRMVKEYLGGASAFLLTVALVINSVMGVLAYTVGMSAMLDSVTGIVAAFWVVVLFVVAGVAISRNSVQSTVASALSLGALNLVLLAVLALIGLTHIQPANLFHMSFPGVGGSPLDLSLLGLIFGALVIAFFGHTSVGNCAAVVLRRDPSARSLIRGVITAQITTIAIYTVWILGINGSLDADVLAGETATVLEPLAAVAGPSVYVAGTIFVLVAMGTGLTHKAGVLVSAMREWFPRKAHPVVLLQRGQGRMVFEPRGSDPGRGPSFVLTYLGLQGNQPRLRLQAQMDGRSWRAEHVGSHVWTAQSALDQLPDDVLNRLDVTFACLTAEEAQIRLRVTTSMRMRFEGSWTSAGLDLASLLGVGGDEADPDAALLQWMLRQGGVTAADAAAWSGQSEPEMHGRLRALAEREAVREVQQGGTTLYRARVARRRARQVPEGLHPSAGASAASIRESVWAAIRARTARILALAHRDRGRQAIEFAPLVGIALFAEWLVLHDRASFTGLLSFSGTIAVPVFVGLFPSLLLLSSRRKGDLIPGVVSRILGRPWLVFSIYAFFLISILLHGLVVWQEPGQRTVAILVVAVALVITVLAIRQGAFDDRTVVTLREDRRPDGGAVFEIVSGGERTLANVRLRYANEVEQIVGPIVATPDYASLREISAQLAPGEAREIKVWANRVTPDGEIQSMPAHLRVLCGAHYQRVDLGLSGGTALLSRGGDACEIEIMLDQPTTVEPEPSEVKRARREPVDVHALLSSSSGSPER